MNVELYKQLRTILVALYPDIDDLRRVARDAGVAVDRVRLEGSAINQWDELLREAVKNQQVADLLDVARQEYDRNTALQAVYALFLDEQKQKRATPLPDRGLVVLNFNRDLTPAQQGQIEQHLEEAIHDIIPLGQRFLDERPYGPQCIALLDSLKWSRQQWESTPLLIVPPGFAPAALVVTSIIHGRRGHFPALVRLRPETTGLQTTYVLAEIVNLQALRHGSHGTAYPT